MPLPLPLPLPLHQTGGMWAVTRTRCPQQASAVRSSSSTFAGTLEVRAMRGCVGDHRVCGAVGLSTPMCVPCVAVDQVWSQFLETAWWPWRPCPWCTACWWRGCTLCRSVWGSGAVCVVGPQGTLRARHGAGGMSM
jgi:hypothetical protein